MSEVINKIRSRGYWEVLVRPTQFAQSRVAYGELLPLLDKHAVRLRGWPVPFIDHGQQPLRGQDWIGQDFEPRRVVDHVEAWRFFTSGQFTQLRGIGADWRNPDDRWVTTSARPPADFNSVIEIWEILFYVTEVFELATRLAFTVAGDESMTLHVRLRNLGRRALVVGDPRRTPLSVPYGPPPDEVEFDRNYSREQLVAESRDAAVDMAGAFMQRFGWGAPKPLLSDYLQELTGSS